MHAAFLFWQSDVLKDEVVDWTGNGSENTKKGMDIDGRKSRIKQVSGLPSQLEKCFLGIHE